MLFYSMSVAFWDRVLRIPIFIPDLQIPEGSLGSAPLPQGWGRFWGTLPRVFQVLTNPLPSKFRPLELREVMGMLGESQGHYILIPESTTSSRGSRGTEGPPTPLNPILWGGIISNYYQIRTIKCCFIP